MPPIDIYLSFVFKQKKCPILVSLNKFIYLFLSNLGVKIMNSIIIINGRFKKIKSKIQSSRRETMDEEIAKERNTRRKQQRIWKKKHDYPFDAA